MDGGGVMQWLPLAFNVLVTIVGVLVGYLLKSVLDRVKNLEDADEKLAMQVHALAVALPTNYVSKEDHKDALDKIFGALRRIEEKLDRKVDKA